MPNIQHSVANANTITLQDQLTEFDILLPDLPFNPTYVFFTTDMHHINLT